MKRLRSLSRFRHGNQIYPDLCFHAKPPWSQEQFPGALPKKIELQAWGSCLKAPLSYSKTPETGKSPPHHKKSLALLEKEIWFDNSWNQKPFPLIKKWLEKESKTIFFPHFHATNVEHFLLTFISKITIWIQNWRDYICPYAFPFAGLKIILDFFTTGGDVESFSWNFLGPGNIGINPHQQNGHTHRRAGRQVQWKSLQQNKMV